MNKKGFTLVELLALIGLMAIIVLIGAPNMLNQIENQRKKNYENFMSDICLASESYINHSDNLEGIDEFKEPGDTISIKMETLISNGFVKSNTKNPKKKEIVKPTDTILVTITEDMTYSCVLSTEN